MKSPEINFMDIRVGWFGCWFIFAKGLGVSRSHRIDRSRLRVSGVLPFPPIADKPSPRGGGDTNDEGWGKLSPPQSNPL